MDIEARATRMYFNFPVYAIEWKINNRGCNVTIGTRTSRGMLIRFPLVLVTARPELVNLLSNKPSGFMAFEIAHYIPDSSETLYYEKEDKPGMLWIASRELRESPTRHLVLDVIEFSDHCRIRTYTTDNCSEHYHFVTDEDPTVVYLLRLVFLDLGAKFVTRISHNLSHHIQLIRA